MYMYMYIYNILYLYCLAVQGLCDTVHVLNYCRSRG